MDNAMVKRGIGAVVLAIIAALLLGYLLKDKSREREEVVMKLPNAPEMNIPSLTGSTDTETKSATLFDNAKEKVEAAGNNISKSGSAIIASATGITEKANDAINSVATSTTTAVDSTSATIQGMKPGFAIRPPQQNEEKEIVDNTKTVTADKPRIEETAKKVKDTVIASANDVTNTVKKAFKPKLVEKAIPKKVKPKAPINTSISATPLGKYSIQLLATSSQSRANKLAKTMKGEGYKVFVTQATREDKILYRVRVGGHGDRNAAIKAQDGMKRRYRKNFFVQNSLVISN